MTKHSLSDDDRRFRTDFEAGAVPPAQFNHRAHVRLAYSYLAESDEGTALTRMRAGLLAFLQHNGIDVSKYHETMTRGVGRLHREPDIAGLEDHDDALLRRPPVLERGAIAVRGARPGTDTQARAVNGL